MYLGLHPESWPHKGVDSEGPTEWQCHHDVTLVMSSKGSYVDVAPYDYSINTVGWGAELVLAPTHVRGHTQNPMEW